MVYTKDEKMEIVRRQVVTGNIFFNVIYAINKNKSVLQGFINKHALK